MLGNIYKITNIINNKCYIGKTFNSISNRFKIHIRDSRKVMNVNRPLYRAFKKYGIDKFVIELIGSFEEDILSEKEIQYIKENKSFHYGYNATLGGEGSRTITVADQDIINKYYELKHVYKVAEHYDISVDMIRLTLNNNSIPITYKTDQAIMMLNKEGIRINSFNSTKEASEWIINNNYSDCKDSEVIRKSISRTTNGNRKSYLGYIWVKIA